ncbi:hypothetical protein ElyMa_006392900 [Elysia marginata]|uniref:Uncharacterized protein n=1 Tax=Elysia marginata TaxID=1093978 RepID=A0AAV4HPW9_9GAST|nr:hypothetical protein ElyMa_006392900 [Elysia marginata]
MTTKQKPIATTQAFITTVQPSTTTTQKLTTAFQSPTTTVSITTTRQPTTVIQTSTKTTEPSPTTTQPLTKTTKISPITTQPLTTATTRLSATNSTKPTQRMLITTQPPTKNAESHITIEQPQLITTPTSGAHKAMAVPRGTSSDETMQYLPTPISRQTSDIHHRKRGIRNNKKTPELKGRTRVHGSNPGDRIKPETGSSGRALVLGVFSGALGFVILLALIVFLIGRVCRGGHRPQLHWQSSRSHLVKRDSDEVFHQQMVSENDEDFTLSEITGSDARERHGSNQFNTAAYNPTFGIYDEINDSCLGESFSESNRSTRHDGPSNQPVFSNATNGPDNLYAAVVQTKRPLSTFSEAAYDTIFPAKIVVEDAQDEPAGGDHTVEMFPESVYVEADDIEGATAC